MSNNYDKNSGDDNNSPQRTSPRFSNSNNAPQYYDNNYQNNGINNLKVSSTNNSDHVSPTRGKKRNSSNRIFSALEEQQATIESSMNSNNMHLYLQKLDLLYQNLEGRVQKLELIVSDQFLITTSNPPYDVVSRNAQISNSGAGFSMSDFSIASKSTSSSASILIPTVSSTVPTSSSTSTICSLLEPFQKEITVNISHKI